MRSFVSIVRKGDGTNMKGQLRWFQDGALSVGKRISYGSALTMKIATHQFSSR